MKTFIKFLVLLIVFITGINSPVISQSGKGTSSDSVFINRNLSDNLNYISLAQLGEQKSNDQEIKRAAQQIINDHKETISELKQIGVKLEVFKAEIASATAVKELETAISPAFEKLWLAQMIGRQESKIEELENTSAQINSAELRSAATRELQKIKIHKDMLSRIKYKYK